MIKIVILYASMTGNTEEIAEIIGTYLEKQNVKIERYQIGYDKLESTILDDADGMMIGTYTDGDGDIPFEAEDLYDDLAAWNLTDRPVGLFGSCDSWYDSYGGAIDTFANIVKECGAKLPVSNLKIELSPEAEDIKKCHQFASDFMYYVNKKTKDM
ncbi:flavodoxin [Paraliobacillus ryukyuensis]|uniref:Flavodoxin I n=1 Tax=Paraliobacillus ryukyuensis TaxID=200904 RepID=A0A366E6S0_9BACI|nr:flavodoxin domain-containing protein [Paraliobacillus ryukyuensis]RBO98091.1 flavodoxin I [Paraliobacillus ryukyuensis]